MAIKHLKEKNGETLYIKNVPVVYASVHETKQKYQSKEREYSFQVFLSQEDRDELEENVMVNKELFEVGKDRNKRKKIKFPVKDAEGNETAFTPYKGLHGITLTLNEKTKKGKRNNLVVVGPDGKPTKELIGNGSTISVKLFGYRNQDDMLVIMPNLIKVHDLVPYEGGASGVHDDELGVDLSFEEAGINNDKGTEESEQDDSDDFDDAPFDSDDDDDSDDY